MENLFFCLNATLPIFFTMLLGYGFRKIGLLDESFIKKINRFVFRAALPLLLLEDLWSADFQTLWDGKFVGFCAAITIGGGLVSVLCSRLVKDENIRGEFAQAAFRSNSALLGIAFISNIYGKSDMASLMLIGNVPFNNILAVIILLFEYCGFYDGYIEAKNVICVDRDLDFDFLSVECDKKVSRENLFRGTLPEFSGRLL